MRTDAFRVRAAAEEAKSRTRSKALLVIRGLEGGGGIVGLAPVCKKDKAAERGKLWRGTGLDRPRALPWRAVAILYRSNIELRGLSWGYAAW